MPTEAQKIAAMWANPHSSIPAGQPFGFLCWWTVKTGLYQTQELHKQALSWLCDLPTTNLVLGFLTGASPATAWTKATQLGAKGRVSLSNSVFTTARYLTRDVGKETRAVVREVIDKDKQLVSTEQLALLTRDDEEISVELDFTKLPDAQRANELLSCIGEMQADMTRRIGSIDDEKIRILLGEWLQDLNRLNLRERGGVYFIPSPPPGEQALAKQQVILDMRKWVLACELGSFSVVRLYNDEATTISEIQQSAVEEVTRELEEIDRKLSEYQQNPNMNAGSRMWSADSQVGKVAEVGRKVLALQESLGDIAGRIQATYQLVDSRARKMHSDNSIQVTNGDGNLLPDGSRTPTAKPTSKGKKSGTVLSRKGTSL